MFAIFDIQVDELYPRQRQVNFQHSNKQQLGSGDMQLHANIAYRLHKFERMNISAHGKLCYDDVFCLKSAANEKQLGLVDLIVFVLLLHLEKGVYMDPWHLGFIFY